MNEYSVKKMSEYPVNPSPLSEDLIPTITVEGGKFVNRNIEFSKLKGDKGDTGPQGEPGDDGNTGASGKAATIEVGSVSTGPAGSSATVENTGDEYDAVLDFTIPKGDKGDQGDPGVVQSVNGKSQEDVVLDTDDIADTATNRYTNDTDIARLANTSGANTGDQDLSGLATDAELTAGLATKEPTITAGTTSQYYRGDKTWQTLNTTAVGIPNVNNTSDMDKPVSTAQGAALAGKVDKSALTSRVYATDGAGSAQMIPFTGSPTANTVATRATGGALGVGTPTSTDHATTKLYVDTADALKLNRDGSNTMTGQLIVSPASAQSNGTARFIQNADNVSNSFRILRSNLSASANIWVASDSSARIDGDINGSLPVRINEGGTGGFYIRGLGMLSGTGLPNGVISAPVGSIYIDTAVTNGASSWIKKSGTGNTGWQVLEGDTGWRDIIQYVSANFSNVTSSTNYLRIRRVGNIVKLFGRLTVAATSLGPVPLLNLDATSYLATFIGLRGQTQYAPIVAITAADGWNAPGQAIIRSFFAIEAPEVARITSGQSLSLDMTWATSEAWPTTLPGTAA